MYDSLNMTTYCVFLLGRAYRSIFPLVPVAQWIICIAVLLLSSAHAQPSEKWLGYWVQGERGARIYQKIKIADGVISFAPGGQDDMDKFPPLGSKVWCGVGYRLESRSTGMGDSSNESDRGRGRIYETISLKMDHPRCGGFLYIDMVFYTDIENYAGTIEYDDRHHIMSRYNYHKVVPRIE